MNTHGLFLGPLTQLGHERQQFLGVIHFEFSFYYDMNRHLNLHDKGKLFAVL